MTRLVNPKINPTAWQWQYVDLNELSEYAGTTYMWQTSCNTKEHLIWLWGKSCNSDWLPVKINKHLNSMLFIFSSVISCKIALSWCMICRVQKRHHNCGLSNPLIMEGYGSRSPHLTDRITQLGWNRKHSECSTLQHISNSNSTWSQIIQSGDQSKLLPFDSMCITRAILRVFTFTTGKSKTSLDSPTSGLSPSSAIIWVARAL